MCSRTVTIGGTLDTCSIAPTRPAARPARRFTEDRDGAARRLDQAEHRADDGRLIRTIRTEQGDGLAGTHVEIDTVQRDDVAVALGDAREARRTCQHGHSLSPAVPVLGVWRRDRGRATDGRQPIRMTTVMRCR